MSLIPFESSWKKKEEREGIRQARETILAAAEAKALKASKRKKAENSWMLPGLEDQIETENKSKSKKSKKTKKEKKSKKKKKKRSSSESDSSNEDEWIEKKSETKETEANTKQPQSTERDAWMDFGNYVAGRTIESKDLLREKDKKKAAKDEEDRIRQEKWKSRELNPNLRSDASTSNQDEKKSQTVVGDGGANWLRRAFKRAEEQAQRDGKTIEEVAAVRWGSLQNFQQLLDKAEGKLNILGKDSTKDRSRDRSDYIRDRERKRSTSRERKRSKSRERKRSKSRERKRSKSGDRSNRRSRSRERKRSKSLERKRSKSRERKRSKSRDRSNRRSTSRERSNKRGTSRDRSSKRLKSRSRERQDPRIRGSPSPDGSKRPKFSRPDLDSESICRPATDRPDTKGVGRWKTQDRRIQERFEESETRQKSKKSSSSSSSSSSDDERTSGKEEVASVEPVKAPIMTEHELNTLGAKLVKAELLGNSDLAERLKAQLTESREARARHLKEGDGDEGGVVEEVVVLTRTDAKGMTRPVEANVDSQKGSKKKKKKIVATHNQDRERQRYFPDDDKFDLKTMFEREKLSTAEDQNALLSRLAGRGMETTNQEYDMDDVMVSRAAADGQSNEDASRDRAKAVAEHRKLAKVLDDCKFCFGTKSHQKHLMIALGRTCYLSLPDHASLQDGHCFIIPISHVTCAVQLDEDVHREMQDFRMALTKMFRNDDDSDCVFFESAMSLRHHPHMVLECVPIPKDIGDMAPMYFQKAIQECESEWSHNKKLISLKDKPLRRSIPKGLPYFHVDFGADNGFAHVIEDEKEFPKNFAQEIIGGMLDLEPRVWRHPRRESFDNQRKKVIEFGAKWKEVDFTKKRKEKSDSSSSSSDED